MDVWFGRVWVLYPPVAYHPPHTVLRETAQVLAHQAASAAASLASFGFYSPEVASNDPSSLYRLVLCPVSSLASPTSLSFRWLFVTARHEFVFSCASRGCQTPCPEGFYLQNSFTSYVLGQVSR